MKTTLVQPYLFFGGRCEEAFEFYRAKLGAEVGRMMRFKESPDPMPEGMLPPGFENKVMHAEVRIGSTTVMASDGCEVGGSFKGFALSLTAASADEATRTFEALAEGGKVTMPLGKTFWSPLFGMLTDRFGIDWMVGVAAEDGRAR